MLKEVHTPNKVVIWQNFEGNRERIEDIEYQHLCNIYYYMKYTMAGLYEDDVVQSIKDELAKRFDDILLPYRPLRRFTQEIETLQKKGWLRLKPDGTGHDVIINDEWIGEVDESMF